MNNTSNEKPEIKAASENALPKPQANPPADAPPKSHQSKILILFTLFLLIVAVVLFLFWFFYLRFHESTDDAYANGNMINVNAAVPGSVISFFADDTDLVLEGQLLVLLDDTKYKLAYEEQLASLAADVLQVKQLYDNVKVNTANRDSRRISLQKAKYDYDNRAQLVSSLSVSNEDFTHAKDDFSIAEFNFKQAESQLKMALDAAGNTSMEKHPLIEERKARVREAYYNLKHCAIYAPATGYVALRVVEVGKWVQTTTPIMAIIPTDYVWVDANFKETQLTKMRVGQPAEVTLDIYGSDVVYKGKVLGIASGTGSIFSIIPPQNATGNWIKIVQRLPVRISLDPEVLKQFPVRLGLSAYVDVDVTDVSLPMLVQRVSDKPVSTTNVFDIDFSELDKIMDMIIEGA